VAAHLNLEIKEIYNDNDLQELKERIPPQREPFMALVAAELNDETDAITFIRRHHSPWERMYLAVINCRGQHVWRRYFSKWHEIGHLLVRKNDLSMARHQTESSNGDGEEILVDRIAAVFAFYRPIFEPVLWELLENGQQLARALGQPPLTLHSFVNQIRHYLLPGAATNVAEVSWESTYMVCLHYCPNLHDYFDSAGRKFKRAEQGQQKIVNH
jgi:hypothetical protein